MDLLSQFGQPSQPQQPAPQQPQQGQFAPPPPPPPPPQQPVPQGYGAPPPPAPQWGAPPPQQPPQQFGGGAPMDPLAGLGNAQSTPNTPTMPDNQTAVVEIERCEITNAPNVGFGVIVHYKVLACSDPTQVGASLAYKMWASAHQQQFQSNCKELVRAALNVPPTPEGEQALVTQAEAVIRRACSAANELAGKRMRLTTKGIITKSKKQPFTVHQWSAFVG